MDTSFRLNWRVRLIRERAANQTNGRVCSALECKIHIIIFGISIFLMLCYLFVILPKRHTPKVVKKSIVEEDVASAQRCAHLSYCNYRGDCFRTDDPLFSPMCRCFFLWTGKYCHQFGKFFYILASISTGTTILLLIGAVILIRIIRRPKRRLVVELLREV